MSVPNLDSMALDELDVFVQRFLEFPLKRAVEIFPDQPSRYFEMAGELRKYAEARAKSLRAAANGNQIAAKFHEGCCNSIYKRLPPWAKWE